jgi:hypothetical protein
MNNQAQIDNMMRSFSQIDKVQPKVDLETEKQFQEVYDIIEESELNYEMEKLNLQPKVDFVPSREDFCLLIDGKFDGYVYHFTTLVDMVNDGLTLKSNEKFVRMTEMTLEQLQNFLANRK